MTPTCPCRRPGCHEDAVAPLGFCVHHDLHYHRWRAWRDALDADQIAATGHPADQPLPEPLAQALDTLHRWLTPGPFSGERTPGPRKAPSRPPRGPHEAPRLDSSS